MISNDVNPNLVIANTLHGVHIEWDNVEGEDRFFRFVIIRNQLNYPKSVLDGIEVFRGTENTFLDTSVKNGEMYYYTLYYAIGYAQKSKNTTYITNNNCRFSITALLEGSMADLFYRNFPRIYRSYDAQVNLEDENFNQPLYRMMKVVGYEFDKCSTFINMIYDVIDIDKCPPTMLPTLMGFLGVDYDWNLSVKENRLLAKIKTSAYRKKGTKPGLRLVLTNLLKSRIEIEIPRVRVKRTATKEEILEKRTITIRAYNFSSDFAWVEDNYEKFLETIKEFVPRKLSVKLVLINNFLDEYVSSNMSDTFKTYVSDTAKFVDTPRTFGSDSLGRTSLKMVKSEEPYKSTDIKETVAYRFTEGRRRVDICTAKATDTVSAIKYVTNSEDSYNASMKDNSVSSVTVNDSDNIERNVHDSFTKSDSHSDYIGNTMKEDGFKDTKNE